MGRREGKELEKGNGEGRKGRKRRGKFGGEKNESQKLKEIKVPEEEGEWLRKKEGESKREGRNHESKGKEPKLPTNTVHL